MLQKHQKFTTHFSVPGEPPFDRPQALRPPLREPGRDPRGRKRALGRGHPVHARVQSGRGWQVRAAHLQQQILERWREGEFSVQKPA